MMVYSANWESPCCLVYDIIGINESKLISNPIQALNQEFDKTVTNITNNSVVKKCFCTII